MRSGTLRDSAGTTLARVAIAETAAERMRGLLGRPPLAPGQALLLQPCGSIHTFGMGYALDVVFLDSDGCACRVVRNVSPCRLAFGGLRARTALEFAAGWLPAGHVAIGAQLEVVPDTL